MYSIHFHITMLDNQPVLPKPVTLTGPSVSELQEGHPLSEPPLLISPINNQAALMLIACPLSSLIILRRPSGDSPDGFFCVRGFGDTAM